MTEACSRARVGISSCLLGERVRHDGGHKHNAYITQTLGRWFEFVPFCPEVGIGLGIPRPTIRLVRIEGMARACGVVDPSLDVTESLVEFAQAALPQLQQLSGYILKSRSPSCGMDRVKVHDAKGNVIDHGRGIFAATLMAAAPELPVEEEGRLMNPILRENFIERVFVLSRWQRSVAKGLSAEALVEFHASHKFSLLAHDESAYRSLGRLVARAGIGPLEPLAKRYIRTLMQALSQPATRGRHANVLTHILGFLKGHLDQGDKDELLTLIDRYRSGQVPLIVPITLLKHHLRRYPQPYIGKQYYLKPHPDELMLRNQL